MSPRTLPVIPDYIPSGIGPSKHRRTPVPDALALTFQAAGERLMVSDSTIRSLVQRGELAAVQVASRRRIAVAELDAYLHWLKTAPSWWGSPEARRESRWNPTKATKAKAWSGTDNGAFVPGRDWIARQKGAEGVFIPGRDRTVERKWAGEPIPDPRWRNGRKRRGTKA